MSDTPQTRRWPIWKILLLTVVSVVVYCIAHFAFAIHSLVSEKIPESYAAWTSGNLVVDYLDTHSNQWPRSWEDLEQATNCQRYVPIKELRTKVKINWDVNFNHLLELARTNPTTPLRLVTRPDGSKLYAKWGPDTEPNYKIMGYLLWVLTQTNTPATAVTTNPVPKLEDSLQ